MVTLSVAVLAFVAAASHGRGLGAGGAVADGGDEGDDGEEFARGASPKVVRAVRYDLRMT